jgi:hypothetical protein
VVPYELGTGWVDLGSTVGWSGSITVPVYTTDTRVNTWMPAYNTSGTTTTYTVNFTPRASGYAWANFEEPRPEIVEARARDRAARVRFREEQELARVSAVRRADTLLLSLLSEEQQQAYRQHGSFEVIGSAGGRYRINQGSVGNVQWIDEHDQAAGRLCAHPDMDEDWLPDGDVALAQLLALTTDERAFLNVANVHAGRRPPLLERAA